MNFQFNQQGYQHLIDYIQTLKPSQIVVITDEHTQLYCLPQLKRMKFTNVNIPVGDHYKNMDTLQYIWNRFFEIGLDRNSLVLNLGGGVVTDMGGFAASTYKRGVKFIHIPTSLLGMVDAAIGGKTGINYQNAKNQLGTIVPPEFTWIHIDFLKTLPQDELLSGYAEMLKHGLIADVHYWDALINFDLGTNHQELDDLIRKSVSIKSEIVAQDPNEKGLRKVLNFGHTLGHAIESYMNYTLKKPFSHGKSVAIGMILSTYLSTIYTGFNRKIAQSIKKEILKKFPVTNWNTKDIDAMIELLKYDKKNVSGVAQFVLLSDIGQPEIDIAVDNAHIKEAFAYYRA